MHFLKILSFFGFISLKNLQKISLTVPSCSFKPIHEANAAYFYSFRHNFFEEVAVYIDMFFHHHKGTFINDDAKAALIHI